MFKFSLIVHSFCDSPAQFSVQKVTPQSDGSSSKVKVKVRVNVHGIFSVSSAALVEVHKSEESEEPMETDQNAKEEEVTAHLIPFVGPSRLADRSTLISFPWKGSETGSSPQTVSRPHIILLTVEKCCLLIVFTSTGN